MFQSWFPHISWAVRVAVFSNLLFSNCIVIVRILFVQPTVWYCIPSFHLICNWWVQMGSPISVKYNCIATWFETCVLIAPLCFMLLSILRNNGAT